ncbi:COP9 signalosome complex subunit 5 [Talaromyces pinophilus]|nr:COP9 signalosome complex subunit 5 [Talaromyces pinophilus]
MQTAQQSWGKHHHLDPRAISQLTTTELENVVQLIDPRRDALYNYDATAHRALSDTKPWAADPRYFKNVKISAVALLKMVMHARSGGSLEVMGLMQGYIASETFVVTDAFRLPVEGTETRVNAQGDANEYMVEYLQSCRDSGRMENAVGWYHSHPGYGCWLSGIDVSTQSMQQMSDPFVAVVIDPDRTISAGKVEIGAFRTYPEGYTAPKESSEDDEYQSIPLNKVEDFGAHASQYYALEVSHFKSTLDTQLLSLLWNKYWVATLSQSPLFTTRDYGSKQIMDLSQKVKRAAKTVGSGGGGGGMGASGLLGGTLDGGAAGGGRNVPVKDQQITKVVRDGNRIVAEEVSGLVAADIKKGLFQNISEKA